MSGYFCAECGSAFRDAEGYHRTSCSQNVRDESLNLRAQVAALQERVKELEASRNIVKAATIRIFEDGCRYQREAEAENARLQADLARVTKDRDYQESLAQDAFSKTLEMDALRRQLKDDLARVTEDRDEWKQQHENLLSVRESDLEVLARVTGELEHQKSRADGEYQSAIRYQKQRDDAEVIAAAEREKNAALTDKDKRWEKVAADLNARANENERALQAERARAKGMEEEARKMFRHKSDFHYIQYAEQLRRTESLGWEQKVKEGRFGKAELDAHCAAHEHLGKHKAFHDAAVLAISPSPAKEAGPGDDMAPDLIAVVSKAVTEADKTWGGVRFACLAYAALDAVKSWRAKHQESLEVAVSRLKDAEKKLDAPAVEKPCEDK